MSPAGTTEIYFRKYRASYAVRCFSAVPAELGFFADLSPHEPRHPMSGCYAGLSSSRRSATAKRPCPGRPSQNDLTPRQQLATRGLKLFKFAFDFAAMQQRIYGSVPLARKAS